MKPKTPIIPPPELHGPPAHEYRIKPEPAFQLPPPPPGMRWHRTNGWQESDLPQGMRPLLLEEHSTNATQQRYSVGWMRLSNSVIAYPLEEPMRTTRPLIFNHAGKRWQWHRVGDPRPCDGNAKICVLTRDGDHNSDEDACCARVYAFGDLTESGLKGAEIIGWRYADEKKTVPLGPEDMKPFTIIRRKGEAQTWHWRTVSYVDAVKVTCGNRGYGWDELASDYERNESLPLTGKWNPDAWEPCHKTIPQNP